MSDSRVPGQFGLLTRPDGRHYAFLATRGSRQMMVVDGIEGSEFERILAGRPSEFPPVIGPTSVTYFGMRKGKLYRMVHALGKDAVLPQTWLLGLRQEGTQGLFQYSPMTYDLLVLCCISGSAAI